MKLLNVLKCKLSGSLSPLNHETMVFQSGLAAIVFVKSVAIVIS